MTLYQKSSPETIQAMFGTIARDYDRGNAVLSLGLHRLWNRTLIRAACIAPEPSTLLDLCAGTGDIALGCLQHRRWKETYLLDFCPEMLAIARAKAEDHGRFIHFLEADAHFIPLEDASVDVATMAYGIRNLSDPAQCAAEVLRVLRPGGRWLVLELTRPRLALLRLLHSIYLRTALPWLGRIVTSNHEAYRYLASSVSQFVAPHELLPRLKAMGFHRATQRTLWGGVATLMEFFH